MKPTPISEVLRRIRPLSREHKIYVLRKEILLAPKRSFLRAELLATLKPILNLELKYEARQAKKDNRSAA